VKAFWEEKKFGHKETTAVPGAFHSAVRALVKQRLIASGGDWASFVFGSSYGLITQKDFERIESDLLASGYRFDVSAVVSAKETPEGIQSRGAGVHTYGLHGRQSVPGRLLAQLPPYRAGRAGTLPPRPAAISRAFGTRREPYASGRRTQPRPPMRSHRWREI
jgi:hypothetical protein